MNLYKKLLHNLENGKLRSVCITSEQRKCGFKGVKVKGKKRTFRSTGKCGHNPVYEYKMSGDELRF